MMDFDPPSAMTRFGMFFLAGGIALIFAFWGVLKWLDQPRPPVAARPEKIVIIPPSVSLSPTPAAQAAIQPR